MFSVYYTIVIMPLFNGIINGIYVNILHRMTLQSDMLYISINQNAYISLSLIILMKSLRFHE